MNEIIKTFSELHPAFGQAAICRLGQHSFLLKVGETMIAVDPFLSEFPGRLVPPLIPAAELEGVDLILGSHDHEDHIDRPALPLMASASPEAKLIVPEALLAGMDCFPRERILGSDDLKRHEVAGVTITGIAAAHEFFDRDAAGHHPYLGYVIHGNGVTIYHSGDCCIYEGLLGKLAAFDCDLLLLPINGRDARRYSGGFIGNMTYQEAADLAGWLETPLTIPGHYDMFAGNTEDPLLFTEYMRVKYPALKTEMLSPGEVRLLTLR
jgi:L-ascorbate metabolism protein UlaG (beta-lactamase superfamily)